MIDRAVGFISGFVPRVVFHDLYVFFEMIHQAGAIAFHLYSKTQMRKLRAWPLPKIAAAHSLCLRAH
eukprot:SAG31_NODE_1987_length_6724_cov_18.235925_2_plen_67_part_00